MSGSMTLFFIELPLLSTCAKVISYLALLDDERKAADKEKVPLRLSRLGLSSNQFELMLGGAVRDTAKEKSLDNQKWKNERNSWTNTDLRYVSRCDERGYLQRREERSECLLTTRKGRSASSQSSCRGILPKVEHDHTIRIYCWKKKGWLIWPHFYSPYDLIKHLREQWTFIEAGHPICGSSPCQHFHAIMNAMIKYVYRIQKQPYRTLAPWILSTLYSWWYLRSTLGTYGRYVSRMACDQAGIASLAVYPLSYTIYYICIQYDTSYNVYWFQIADIDRGHSMWISQSITHTPHLASSVHLPLVYPFTWKFVPRPCGRWSTVDDIELLKQEMLINV